MLYFYPQKVNQRKIQKKLFKPFMKSRFGCDICGLKAVEKHKIRRHINSKHSKEERICEICKKVFMNQFKLREHLARTHQGKKEDQKHECLICGVGYKNYQHVRRHNNELHSDYSLNVPLVSCDICGEKIYSKLQIEKHMILYHSKPFKCLEKNCYRSFDKRKDRLKHKSRCHSRKL